MKFKAMGLVLALACCGAHADGEDTPPEVRRYPIAGVQRVQVEQPSVRKDYGHNSMDCSAFHLTERNVRFFLRHAKPVSKRVHEELLTWAECRGQGSVTFANGDVVDFDIEVWGRGTLAPRTGAHQGRVFYYECDRCEGFGMRRPG